MKHFKTIAELHQAEGHHPPEHPLFGLKVLEDRPYPMTGEEITSDFYMISCKRLRSGEVWYGRTKYDHDTGFMYFMKPGQTLICRNVRFKEKGFSIEFHEDFLAGHPLFTEIKKYSFFDYETHEALHLSPREKEIMWSLYNKMEREYYDNPDEFSKSIILSHIDSLLKYAQRFYRRQFIDRKPLSGKTVTKFNECLSAYFEKGDGEEKGLPTVNYMATQLHVSPKYLSDLLKQETGKTSLELIHLHVISEAKNLLAAGGRSIAEIAYQLGFENPPYFSRLFKKEVGMSPTEYQTQLLN